MKTSFPIGINRHNLRWWARGVQSPPKRMVCRFHPPPLRFGDWIPMDWSNSWSISRQDPPHDFHRSGGNVFSDRLQQFILCFTFGVGLNSSKLTAIGNREVIHPLASKNNGLHSGINKHRWPENGRFFTMYFLFNNLNNGDIFHLLLLLSDCIPEG